MTALNSLLRDKKGASAIEYGLIAALIALPAGVAFASLGAEVKQIFLDMAAVVAAAIT